jgi:hypothetical protein
MVVDTKREAGGMQAGTDSSSLDSLRPKRGEHVWFRDPDDFLAAWQKERPNVRLVMINSGASLQDVEQTIRALDQSKLATAQALREQEEWMFQKFDEIVDNIGEEFQISAARSSE